MILEYVASGLTHTRVADFKSVNNPGIVTAIRKLSKDIQGQNDHNYSVLFNAFTEKKLENVFDCYFNKTMDNIHTDSGGLQIITLGKTVTPELKKEIYTLQARSSDLAMGFDEIPVKIIKTKPKPNSYETAYNTKHYDHSELINCAEKTGANVKEQLQMFIELDSRAKALPVLQGNSVDTYKEWHDAMMKNISSDEKKKIGGLSIGFISFGKGTQETIDICKMINELETDIDYFHLLGLGSIARILPFLILVRNGFFDGKVKRISYDSTSHTQNSSFGAYQMKNDKRISLGGRHLLHDGKCKDRNFQEIWTDFSENMSGFNQYIKDNFGIFLDEETMYYITIKQKEFSEWGATKGFERAHKGLFTFMYFISQVLNMTWTCNKLMKDENYLKQYIQRVDPKLIGLLDVKNTSDFNSWYSAARDHLDPAANTPHKSASDANDLF